MTRLRHSNPPRDCVQDWRITTVGGGYHRRVATIPAHKPMDKLQAVGRAFIRDLKERKQRWPNKVERNKAARVEAQELLGSHSWKEIAEIKPSLVKYLVLAGENMVPKNIASRMRTAS